MIGRACVRCHRCVPTDFGQAGRFWAQESLAHENLGCNVRRLQGLQGADCSHLQALHRKKGVQPWAEHPYRLSICAWSLDLFGLCQKLQLSSGPSAICADSILIGAISALLWGQLAPDCTVPCQTCTASWPAAEAIRLLSPSTWLNCGLGHIRIVCVLFVASPVHDDSNFRLLRASQPKLKVK